MTPIRRRALWVLASVPLFIFAETSGEAHPSAIADLAGKTLNFLILFGGLAFVLVKPIRAFFAARSMEVRTTMAQAASSRDEAQKKLASIRSRLEGVGEEVRKIHDAGRSQGLKDKETIVALAAREADRIRAMAREEIEARGQASRRELRKYAAELAISIARSRIEGRLTPDVQSRLIDESLDILGREHAERRSS